MSSHQDDDAADLQPTFAEGFKLGAKKVSKPTVDEYAELDKDDEALNRWKASLGIGASAAAAGSGPKVTILSLFLTSPTLPPGKTIEMKLADPKAVEAFKKNPVSIKEDVEYNVGIRFQVNYDVISGLRYIHVVKRSGIKVDKLEQMIGSYGPKPDGTPYESNFPTEESPSGMLARSGTYNVKSRIVDDDGTVYADFEWAFKLTKEW
ncbi:hypothetical protein FRC04_003275 [Tulasnella sp. 424]|nr:hypothetical protein FRC04_003275 [Tulasnella sp. 424]KAG8965908.1 hypothetical protein FRC05_002966 [Tulasnella sp. 425]